MKIAFFTETFLPKVDGIVTRLTKTIEFLTKNGDEVIVFCPEGCPDSYKGATIVGVAAMPLPLYPELKLGLPGPAVSDKLEEFKPDLVHVVNPAVLGLGGIWLAKTNNIPLIASYHTHLPKYLEHYGMGMLEPLLWELLKAAHNQALLNLCTSTAMVNELEDKGIQRTALWQRGVDTENFRPELRSEKMREKLFGKYQNTDSLLIYVGRLSAEKQIERIKPVLDNIPGACLALVGDGPYRGQLEKIFENTNTNFIGYLSGEELASAYASGDIFLFPSSTETLGLVLLEAMAAGCPVIGANKGGIPDIINNGINGCLYNPDEKDNGERSLIEATKKILADKNKKEAMRKEARKEAEQWDWNQATLQLQKYYAETLENIS
ncbi:SqdX [Prochlorococcus marinus subsp. pastoris str. CCMP1986]|uniref:SqdX n=1 Tax=Prochlorococcus marinus subsp. pastoris (strain CCMP1986 / NIES-2087 / MED4) TaxID=59919 RepID=Q7UZJ7_PROMP|nr:glycosyltransferase family 1 protein [Prochlorococcus marinus]KGF86912.1 Glycosyltransferase [Prochlorococcus marinus str. EQPAC1]CAE20125.1 SqdX [Prochlorococcus marinus subsp. pastoris str. CCMP1986]